MELEIEFLNWVNTSCVFCSTLVDRIVPGYPKNEFEKLNDELQYIDENIVKGEIFLLWVIAGSFMGVPCAMSADDSGSDLRKTKSILTMDLGLKAGYRVDKLDWKIGRASCRGRV